MKHIDFKQRIRTGVKQKSKLLVRIASDFM